MAVTQIVVGSDARDIAITLVKASDGTALPTPASATLQGRSPDMPGINVDAAMTVAANIVSLAEFGNLVNAGSLGARQSALFTFRVRYLLGAKVDYSREFQYEWVRGPI